MKERVRILIADNEAIVRNGIRAMLEQQNDFKAIVHEVQTGKDAIEFTRKGRIDLIILDIQMPKTNGINAIRVLNEEGSEIPIIAMSSSVDIFVLRRALKLGTMGFIVKDTGMEELTKAIKTVRSSQKYYSNEVAQIMLGAHKITTKDARTHLNLTKREWQILQLLSEEFTTDEIALALKISKRTVEGHRTNLKAKLQVKTTIGLVKFAMENAQHNKWAS